VKSALATAEAMYLSLPSQSQRCSGMVSRVSLREKGCVLSGKRDLRVGTKQVRVEISFAKTLEGSGLEVASNGLNAIPPKS
jgi:hypothetical protein